jgi:hypothetical protein
MKRLLILIPVIAIADVAQSQPGQSPGMPPPALPPSSPVELPTPRYTGSCALDTRLYPSRQRRFGCSDRGGAATSSGRTSECKEDGTMSLLDTIMDALGFEPKHQGFDVAEAVHQKAKDRAWPTSTTASQSSIC